MRVKGISTTAYNILAFIPRGFRPTFVEPTYMGLDFSWAHLIHEWRYCSRCHDEKVMNHKTKAFADEELKWNLQTYLPLHLRLVGFLYRLYLRRQGAYDGFDTCFQRPLDLSPCRHGMDAPAWMLEAAEARGDFGKRTCID